MVKEIFAIEDDEGNAADDALQIAPEHAETTRVEEMEFEDSIREPLLSENKQTGLPRKSASHPTRYRWQIWALAFVCTLAVFAGLRSWRNSTSSLAGVQLDHASLVANCTGWLSL